MHERCANQRLFRLGVQVNSKPFEATALQIICLLIGLLALAPGQKALATDITLLAGYQFNSDFDTEDFEAGSGDVGVDDDAVYGLSVDFVFMGNETQRLGFYLAHQKTEFEDFPGPYDRGLDITHVHFTGMSYYPSGNFEPFVMAGVGVGFFSPDDSGLDDETQFSMQVGAGFNYLLGENLLLRFDVRWLPTFFSGSGSAFCSGGCVVRLNADTYSQVQANAGLMFRF
jgi:opacity protein-like surface antigen